LGTLWNFLSVLLPFLFVLTIVVFIHEMGHFLVARWCGVKVQAFSIGFGREIWGFTARGGGSRGYRSAAT
jgi:regulator of sigma E protease